MEQIPGAPLDKVRNALENNRRLTLTQCKLLYRHYLAMEKREEKARNKIQQLEETIEHMQQDPKFMYNRSQYAITIIELSKELGVPISMREAAKTLGISHTAIIQYKRRQRKED